MTQEEFNNTIIPIWDMSKANENTKKAIVGRTMRLTLNYPELARNWYESLPKTTLDYIMPSNANHRKQRGRTAPNRVWCTFINKIFFK